MNFSFIENLSEFKTLYNYCKDAEDLVYTKPNLSGISCRNVLEYVLKLIYKLALPNISGVSTSYDMIVQQEFVDYIDDSNFIDCLHYVRKMGNAAAHGDTFDATSSLDTLEYTQYIVGYSLQLLGIIDDFPEFEKPIEDSSKPIKNGVDETPSIEITEEIVAKHALKFKDVKFKTKSVQDEKVNKQLFIRASLAEAGWKIALNNNQAFPSTCCVNMMLDSGSKVDKVLYGPNNKPLAIIAMADDTQSLIDARLKGLAQAEELEKKYGYKPIIYYTNGYYIYMIEPSFYDKPRRVFSIHTEDELDLLMQRATARQDISVPKINDNITNRDYQKKAITAVCQAFTSKRRKSLIVMATGTGKTRVSISLVDVLMNANWVKNVLFLADRTSLVKQAYKNYKKLLPNLTLSVYSGTDTDRDSNARVIFSTYQTMINLIDGPNKEFGVGRFDLIIVDEAHRTIFKKYKALFEYFDALMVGLTATPRCEENRSSYQMFDLPNGEPDFAYEIEEAISEHHLVGFNVQDRTTKLLQRGVTYDELSDEEVEQLEETFEGENIFLGLSIDAEYFTRNVINRQTIDLMLDDLMTNGLKIDGGDKIGKTIIFAPNHHYAEIIVEQFNKNYKNLGLDFCKLIDSQVETNQQLIDAFEVRGTEPTIAVSVDMLDTGIDVPDILNLVFFKSVHSKIKFLQMVGRGTRLSKDIFGPGMDKEGFVIFDYFDNFRYFNTHNTWKGMTHTKSRQTSKQSYVINSYKLDILIELINQSCLNTFDLNYKNELLEYFKDSLLNLNNDALQVRNNMTYVNKFRKEDFWNNLDNIEANEDILKSKILPLFENDNSTVKERIFDILIYTLEANAFRVEANDKLLKKLRSGFRNLGHALTGIMEELLKLKTIPEIVAKNSLIFSMIDGEYLFNDYSLEKAEYVRKELRSLLNYIVIEKKYYEVDLVDTLISDSNQPTIITKSYAQLAIEYITNPNNVIIHKISNLDILTNDEKQIIHDVFNNDLGTSVECNTWCGGLPLLTKIRTIVGISDNVLNNKFGHFLNDKFTEEQMNFVNQVIQYAKVNGDITFQTLLKESPFADIDIINMFDTNISYLKELVNGIHKPIV